MIQRFQSLVSSGLAAIFFTFCFLWPNLLFAQTEVKYDPYTNELKYGGEINSESAESRERNQLMARILEQPFRPIGFGIGKTAEWVERKHMDDKTIWFFDELSQHGIYLGAMTPTEGLSYTIGPKARIEVLKLLQIEQPAFTVDVFGGWTPNRDFEGSTVRLGADYKIEPVQSSIFQNGLVRYSRSSSESFYGIGQNTSLGEHSTYEPEELWLESGLGYHITQLTDAHSSFVYQHMNIGNGARERLGKIKEHFSPFTPGIDGGDLIGLVSYLSRDSKDHQDDPKHGGEQGLGFSYFHDVDANEFQYFKVYGNVKQFVPVFSERRILALRLTAEKNQELGNDEIPFFNMARLGGSDIKDGSELLRSYRYNRFFEEGLISGNTEYRYNIYDYGNFQTDAFGMFDLGEVFGELNDISWDDLKYSYGGGFNIKFKRKTIWSFVIAHGNEGWQAAGHTKVSF